MSIVLTFLFYSVQSRSRASTPQPTPPSARTRRRRRRRSTRSRPGRSRSTTCRSRRWPPRRTRSSSARRPSWRESRRRLPRPRQILHLLLWMFLQSVLMFFAKYQIKTDMTPLLSFETVFFFCPRVSLVFKSHFFSFRTLESENAESKINTNQKADSVKSQLTRTSSTTSPTSGGHQRWRSAPMPAASQPLSSRVRPL